MLQQCFQNGHATIFNGGEQRSGALDILQIRIGFRVEEHQCRILLPIRNGVIQRRVAMLVLRVDRRILLQQHFDCRYIVGKHGARGGCHERGTSILIALIYVGALGDKIPSILNPAFFKRFHERWIRLSRCTVGSYCSGARSRTVFRFIDPETSTRENKNKQKNKDKARQRSNSGYYGNQNGGYYGGGNYPTNNGGYTALKFGKTSPLVYSELTGANPIWSLPLQVHPATISVRYRNALGSSE